MLNIADTTFRCPIFLHTTFGHVELGLKQLGLTIADLGLVICTHAHPDHIEAVQLFKGSPALFTLHQEEWNWAVDPFALSSIFLFLFDLLAFFSIYFFLNRYLIRFLITVAKQGGAMKLVKIFLVVIVAGMILACTSAHWGLFDSLAICTAFHT